MKIVRVLKSAQSIFLFISTLYPERLENPFWWKILADVLQQLNYYGGPYYYDDVQLGWWNNLATNYHII